MSDPGRLRDFLAAADAFCAAPCDRAALAKLVAARLRLLDGAEMPSAPWTGMLRVMVALATAAQEAAGREDRRAAIGEALHAALCAWRGDLGDKALRPPRRPPAPIRQYKD